MTGSLSMQKVSHRQHFLFTLPGLVLFAAFLLGGSAEAIGVGMNQATVAEAHGTLESPDCTAGRRTAVNSAVVVSSGEVICGNVTSIGGSVVIHGQVNGDIVAIGGDVVLDGVVNGDVTLYGGNLALQNGTYVNGDLQVCGGRWIEGTASQLHGNVNSCTKSVSVLLFGDVGTDFRFWYTLTWVVLGLVLTTLLPEHVMLVRTTVKSKKRRSFTLGLLSILLAPAIFAVLIALIISIPLAIIMVIGLGAAWALGTIAVGWHIGDRILQTIAPQQNTRLLQVVVGLTVLALAESLPYIGWLIVIGAGLLGIGAVFLSRFGTRLYSQPKQPLPL